MNSLLKYGQRAGLVSALLLIGVMGVLMAPLSSGAATPPSVVSVTMKVDNGTAVNILGTPRACDSTAQNWCYNLLQTSAQGTNAQGKTRKFSILPVSASNPPRLLIADFINSNQQWLTGYILDPLVDSTTLGSGWTALEAHIVTLTIRVKYDSCGKRSDPSGTTCTSNKDSVGVRNLAHLSTGQFIAENCILPLCSGGTNYVKNSRVDISAIVNLGPANPNFVVYNTDQNPVPTDLNQPSTLPFFYQEGLNSSLGTTYSRQSKTLYPSRDCRESSTATTCAQLWTYTIRYSTFGPIQNRKADSDVMIDLLEKLCFSPQGPPTNSPTNPCKNKKYKNQDASLIITDFLDETAAKEIQEGQNAGYPLGQACAIDDPECRCAGPQCAASYLHIVRGTSHQATNGKTITFRGTGPGMGNGVDPFEYPILLQTITLPDGSKVTEGRYEGFSNLPSFGGAWHLEIASFPQDGQRWDMDQISCLSQLFGGLGTKTSDFTDWNEPTGEPKTGHDVFALQGKDVLVCEWHVRANP